MSFGLTPQQYLDMVLETNKEFHEDITSVRRLIAACTLANHLPEIVFAEFAPTLPAKVHGCVSSAKYREHVISECPEAGIVRDLCDYGKHGPQLDRKTVQVDRTDVKERIVLDGGMFLLGIPNHQVADRLVVTTKDGKEHLADWIVACVVGYCKNKFVRDGL